MANISYKETHTKSLKIKGVYNATNGIVTVTDKEGNVSEHSIKDLLSDFNGKEMTLGVTDKEEFDLLDAD